MSQFKKLGLVIREQREFIQESKKSLAKMAQVSSRTISNIENGEGVSVRTLCAVADALGLTMLDLWEYVEEGPEPRIEKTVKAVVGIDPAGNRYESSTQVELAREHGLNPTCVSNCLRGRQPDHYGWTFEEVLA